MEIDYEIIGDILCLFVFLNKKLVSFCDIWFEVLFMDNEVYIDFIIRVYFIEIWILFS